MNQPGKLSINQSNEALPTDLSHNSHAPQSLKFSLSQITTCRSSWEDGIQQIGKSSIPGIGLWKRKLVDVETNQLVDRLMDSGLAVSSMSFIGGFTGSMGMSYAEAMEDAYETMFLAAAVQARCVVIAPGSRGKYSARHERKLVVHAIRELAAMADELRLDLAVLPMRADVSRSWSFLHTLDDAMGLLSQVDCPRAGLAFDAFHLLNDPANLEAVSAIADRIKHVQLSDQKAGLGSKDVRCLPGEGSLPLQPLVQSLVANNYRGHFDVPVWPKHSSATPTQDVIQRCEDWFRMLNAQLPATQPTEVNCVS